MKMEAIRKALSLSELEAWMNAIIISYVNKLNYF